MTQYICDSKQISLNSSSATITNSPYNSQCTFNINGALKYDKDILYNQISVIHAQIPVSYYICNYTNNTLNTSVGNFTLTRGNYNANSFKTMLLGILGAGWGMSLNTITGVFTITYSSDFTIYSTSTCQKLLGLGTSQNYSSTSSSLLCPYPCNFVGISKLKIKSNLVVSENMDSNARGRCNLLTTIPVSTNSFGVILYNNNMGFKNMLANYNLDFVDISITDELDNLVNFNGVDWNLSLQIDSYRSKLPEGENLASMMHRENP